MKPHSCLIIVLLLVFAGPSFAQTDSALEQIKAAAEAGDPAAQMKLGEKFILRQDQSQAEIWYRKSAGQGYAPAQAKVAERLLNNARMLAGLKPEVRTSLAEEGVKWALLAANQGNQLGQAKLAETYAEGKFLKPDWIQAYKWAELAARQPGSMFNPAGVSARSFRDSAILKLSSQELAEAKQLVAEFSPHSVAKSELPEPSWVQDIKLSGLSGPPDHRLAIINGTTFAQGESGDIKVGGRKVTVTCKELREKSVLVQAQGLDQPLELNLTNQ